MLTLSPAKFDSDISTLDISGFAETFAEGSYTAGERGRRFRRRGIRSPASIVARARKAASLPPRSSEHPKSLAASRCFLRLMLGHRSGSNRTSGSLATSLADIQPLNGSVRFTPNSGHQEVRPRCPLSANTGLMRRSKKGSLFDHIIGAGQHGGRKGEAERFGGAKIPRTNDRKCIILETALL